MDCCNRFSEKVTLDDRWMAQAASPEKVKVISLCWFTMKEWDLFKCFCTLNAVLIATSSME